MTRENSSLPDNLLKEMLEKQRDLLYRYQSLEKMPSFPLDLTTKESQGLIKKTVGRITEELAEAYSIQEALFMGLSEGRATNTDIVRMIRDFNEEMADVFHFALELLILCDLDYDNLIEKLHTNLLFSIDDTAPIDRMYEAAHIIAGPLYMECNELRNSPATLKVYEDDSNSLVYMNGGIYQSNDLLEYQAKILWWTVWKFNQATNLLKHREWRQEEVYELSKVELQEKLIDSFMNLIFYFSICNINPESLYYSYKFKNTKNHARIDEGY